MNTIWDVDNLKSNYKIYKKTLAVIRSCTTYDHCKTTHKFMMLSYPYLTKKQQHIVDQTYITKTLRITGVIA